MRPLSSASVLTAALVSSTSADRFSMRAIALLTMSPPLTASCAAWLTERAVSTALRATSCRITGIVLAHLHLLVVQGLAGPQQCITLLLDVLEQGVDAGQRRTVSVQRGPVGGRNEMNANGQLGAPSRR